MKAGPSFSSSMVYAGVAGPDSMAALAVLSIVLAVVAAWALLRRGR